MLWSVIFIIAVIISIVLMLTVFRKTLVLNHKALHEQKLAYVAVLFPCCLALIIICVSDYGRLDIFNSQAQGNFMSLAKVPLIIVGLSTVLLSIVVNAHRTIQTKRQIEVTEKKNGTDYFLNHYKMFTGNTAETVTEIECNACKKNPKLIITDTLRLTVLLEQKRLNILYSVFFPENNLENGVVNVKPRSMYEEFQQVIIKNMMVGIPDAVKDDFLNELEDTAASYDSNPAYVYGFDAGTYLSLDDVTLEQDRMLGYEKIRVLSVLIKDIVREVGKLLAKYCVSTKIEFDDKVISNELVKFLLFTPQSIELPYEDKITIIIGVLAHFLDLQVALGDTYGEGKARAYLYIYENYLNNVYIQAKYS